VVDLLLSERRPAATAAPAPDAGRGWRTHWPLAALLVAGLVLRALAMVAIAPGIWFSDSNGYVSAAATGSLQTSRVDGYALVVAPFWRLGSAAALIGVQHLIGLAIVAALYALLVRRGGSRWVQRPATLA
jgi:hypothetical protein